MMMQQGGVLPPGYTQLEYVQGTGRTGLNLGIVAQLGDNIVIDMVDDADTGSANNIIFGYGTSGGSWVARRGWNGTYYIGEGGFPIQTTQRVVGYVELGQEKFILRIDEYTATRNINRNFDNYYIFGVRNNFLSLSKVYSLTIFRDGDKICDLIPCKNTDDEVGYYDVVRQIFLKYY